MFYGPTGYLQLRGIDSFAFRVIRHVAVNDGVNVITKILHGTVAGFRQILVYGPFAR